VVGVRAQPGRGFTAVNPCGVTPLLLFRTLLCLLSLLRNGCPAVALTFDGASLVAATSSAGSSSATAATAEAKVLSVVIDVQHLVVNKLSSSA
jgi:hypothetical protein